MTQRYRADATGGRIGKVNNERVTDPEEQRTEDNLEQPPAIQNEPSVASGTPPIAQPAINARKFAVLRSRATSPYIIGAALSMMGDNVEHVITYWVLWQTFHSPLLVGFQIVSHWLPFLLLSVYAGSLAERFDCRRLIQIAQGLFMLVSLCWGILFLTGTLQLWEACVLLVMHGMAGCLWGPAEQMMLYDFAGPKQLPSAVRINATFRSLGGLLGPVVGSALLVGLGPTAGIFINIACYLPMTIFLMRTRFTGHTRRAVVHGPRMTLISAFKVLGTVRQNRALTGMVMLAAIGAITVGAVVQNSMPLFANLLGAGSAGLAYGVLLFANGIGGVVGGFFLEASDWVKPSRRTAVIAAVLLGLSTVVFAISGNYALAVIALIIGGFARITSDSTEMSIVQLEAPDAERGRVIGAYSMFSRGMSTFSGVTVAVLGSLMGIPSSVLIGGGVLAIGALLTAGYMARAPSKA